MVAQPVEDRYCDILIPPANQQTTHRDNLLEICLLAHKLYLLHNAVVVRTIIESEVILVQALGVRYADSSIKLLNETYSLILCSLEAE